MSKTPKAPRRATRPTTPRAPRRPAAAVEGTTRRPAPGAAQTEAKGAATPDAPTAARPVQSTPTDPNATTASPLIAYDVTRRALVVSMLCALPIDTARLFVSMLVTWLSALNRAALRAVSTPGERALRVSRREAAAATSQFLSRDALFLNVEPHAVALSAVWFLYAPLDVAAGIEGPGRSDEIAAALADVEAACIELRRIEAGFAELARREALCDVPYDVGAFVRRSITERVASAVYLHTREADGFGDVASGLAALTLRRLDACDAATLAAGLARLARTSADHAAEAPTAAEARAALADARELFEAAADVAREAVSALDAAPEGTHPEAVAVGERA